jgi:uncharacterized membrane protein YeaQ/YmgE (transglycosylase-associated protein family)
MFQLLGTILIGFLAGVLAKLIMPGKQNMGFIMTTVLGIVGAFLATWLGRLLHWYDSGESAHFIGAIVGAILVLVIYGFIKKRGA